jgi:uncharacterized protein YndB with AHSA1/START domain
VTTTAGAATRAAIRQRGEPRLPREPLLVSSAASVPTTPAPVPLLNTCDAKPLAPSDSLACSFQPGRTWQNGKKVSLSKVTFELEPAGEQVKLTVTHDDFVPGSEMRKGVSAGWPQILAGLKSLLETG